MTEDLIKSSRNTMRALSAARDGLLGDSPLYRESGRAIVALEMLTAALEAASAQSGWRPEPLTDERIDRIADITVRGMENGLRGFMTVWGWQHFARNLLDACGQRVASPEVSINRNLETSTPAAPRGSE